jgi:hypothetical protein
VLAHLLAHRPADNKGKKNNQLAMGKAVAAARQRDVGGSLAAALRRQQRQRRWRQREARRWRTARRWQRSGSSAVAAAVAAAAVAVVEAVEDNLLAKAAGNESVDGHMTACNDEIGRWTTTQQPTNEWRRRWRQRDSARLAAARQRRTAQRRQRGSSSAAAAAVAAARKRDVGGSLLSVGQCDGYGASLGGTLCFINNPTLRLLSYLSTYDE